MSETDPKDLVENQVHGPIYGYASRKYYQYAKGCRAAKQAIGDYCYCQYGKYGHWKYIKRAIGVLTLLFLIAYTIITGNILAANKRANAISIANHVSVNRAFMFLDDWQITAVAADAATINEPIKNVQSWVITPYWKNSGNTPTKNLTIKLICGTAVQNVEPQFDWNSVPNSVLAKSEGHVSRVFGPQQHDTGGVCVGSADLYETMIRSKQMYYIVAMVTYQDVFQPTQHVTRYCFQSHVTGDPHHLPMGLSFLDGQLCPGNNNCADEECEKK